MESVPESKPGPGEPDRKIVPNLNRVSSSESQPQFEAVSASESDIGGVESSKLKLNLNLDVDVENGKPERLHLPHGQLVLMFLPKRGGQKLEPG